MGCVIKNSLCFLVLSSICCSAWGQLREVALLDLVPRNGDSNVSKLIATQHALSVAGVPFVTTTDLAVAVQYAMIVCDARIQSSTLDAAEETVLIDYVNGGGILLSPRVSESNLYPLFGITSQTSSTTHFTTEWNMAGGHPEMVWFDDPLEQTISLGRDTSTEMFHTKHFTVDTAAVLASYGDGPIAITRNQYGAGFAYQIGFSFKDVVIRNLLNLDYSAQRSYSNGFEPTTDTIMLFLRGIYTSRVPYGAWKHTSPYASDAVMMMTHDVDSTTGMQRMAWFAELEENSGLQGTYMITTHYISDAVAGDFYTPHTTEIAEIHSRGHLLESHSVGHFPDFHDETVFPEGSPGNTMATYTPSYDGSQTTGGTVFGEFEVSKLLLENDFGASISLFRSGHLAFNEKQFNVLALAGYDYDTTNSANDLLTNFPYQGVEDSNFSGALSTVWEIPMTISDVFPDAPISIDNYADKAAIWFDVTQRNADNYASTVLLIHPNRDYKVWAEDLYLQSLPTTIMQMNPVAFGDYWKQRNAFSYSSELNGSDLLITVPDAQLPLNSKLSIVVHDGALLNSIEVRSEGNQLLSFQTMSWEGNDLLVYQDQHHFVRVTSPNGGEVLIGGQQTTVTWNSSSNIPAVDLDYSIDDGTSWVGIASGTANSGSYSWSVPEITAAACRIRVSEPAAWSSDISNSAFAIEHDTGLVFSDSFEQ